MPVKKVRIHNTSEKGRLRASATVALSRSLTLGQYSNLLPRTYWPRAAPPAATKGNAMFTSQSARNSNESLPLDVVPVRVVTCICKLPISSIWNARRVSTAISPPLVILVVKAPRVYNLTCSWPLTLSLFPPLCLSEALQEIFALLLSERSVPLTEVPRLVILTC